MKNIKINYWEVKGYRGHSDYDGPQDNNFYHVVAVDSRFTKDEVLDMMFRKFSSKYRVVVLTATLWKTVSDDDRIHAYWIESDTSDRTDKIHKIYTCSNCRDTETWIQGHQGKYCPGCGAIMDCEPSNNVVIPKENNKKLLSREEFEQMYCYLCSSIACDRTDECVEACAVYQKEVLGQPTIHDIIEEINKQRHPATFEEERNNG